MERIIQDGEKLGPKDQAERVALFAYGTSRCEPNVVGSLSLSHGKNAREGMSSRMREQELAQRSRCTPELWPSGLPEHLPERGLTAGHF